MNWLLHRNHSVQPPFRQLAHLAGHSTAELFAVGRACALSGVAQGGKRRHRCRDSTRVGEGIGR
jgi:hypothetical protein